MNTKIAKLVVFVSVVLAGCTTEQLEPLASQSPLPLPSATYLPPDKPTPTFLATPDLMQDGHEIIEYLFSGNGQCDLPCWWGIKPGETSWESAFQFLNSFAVSVEKYEFPPNRIEYYVQFAVPANIQKTGLVGFSFGVDSRGIVNEIKTEANWIVVAPDYSIFGLLQRFGKPEEIKIFAIVTTPVGPVYSIALVYPGIIFHKNGDAELLNGEVEICPTQLTTATRLWLWSTIEDRQFEDVVTGHLFREGENEYRDLEDVSDLDTDSFFQKFSNQSTQDCLKIVRELWY